MLLKRLPTGILQSNCYIIGEKTKGAVIDPGVSASEIIRAADDMGLEIIYIILTHTHFDHIKFMDDLRDRAGAKVLAHEADAPALSDSWLNGSVLFGQSETFREADKLLKDGDIIDVDGISLEVIHTPGHTPGSICIKANNWLFTGDTLFRMSIGRTDLGNGSHEDIMRSITQVLMKLDDDTVVYPGHGTSSTIGFERKHNPFI